MYRNLSNDALQSDPYGFSSSLLRRISPPQPSLLHRIQPASPSPSPVSPGVGLSLAERLREDEAVDRRPAQVKKEGLSGNSFRQTSSGPRSLALRISDGISAQSAISVTNSQEASPIRVKLEEEESTQDIMPVSEAAVNQLLASVLDMDVIAKKQQIPDINAPAASDPPPARASRAVPVLEHDLIEECRELLLPQLVKNARRREPDLGTRSTLIEQCARNVLTDEHCKDFVQLAREVRAQTQRKEHVETPRAGAGEKRAREADAMEVDDAERGMKSRRLDSPTVGSASAIAQAETRPPASSPVSAPKDAVPPSPAPKVPTGPRAMLKNRAVRAMEEYLATVSSKVGEERGPAHASHGSGDMRLPSVPVAPSRPTSDRRSNGTLRKEEVAMDVDVPAKDGFRHPQSQPRPPEVLARHPPEYTGRQSRFSSAPVPSHRPAPDLWSIGPPHSKEVAMDIDVPVGEVPRHTQSLLSSQEVSQNSTGSGGRPSRFSVHAELGSMPPPHTQVTRQPLPAPLEERRPPTPPLQVSTEVPPRAPPVPHNDVPGLWCVKAGRQKPGILEITFDVEVEVAVAAQQWAQRKRSFDAHASHVSVYLLCLPISSVVECNARLDPAASTVEVAAAMMMIETAWPTRGSLVVEMNPGSGDTAKTWLPPSLGPKNGPLDMTACVRPGTNTLQLIQLSDMSDYVFAVHAARPSAEERASFAVLDAEARDWARFYAKTSSRQSRVARSTSSMSVPAGRTLGLVA